MSQVILQSLSSVETRAVRTACLLMDIPTTALPLENLDMHADALRRGVAMPVGSVEFVRRAMALAGIEEPRACSYPEALQPWLHRTVRRATASEALATKVATFVKPVTTKLFTGFVLPAPQQRDQLDEHDCGQLADLQALQPGEPVWLADPVEFASEVRYYVQAGRVMGLARYDPDGADSAELPDATEVQAAIEAYACPHPYALDMGVLQDGRTALVEVQDAWAIGLYGGAMEPKTYYRYLRCYWDALVSRAR